MKMYTMRLALYFIACIGLLSSCRKEKPDPPEPETGQVLFWTANDLGCGNITVTVDGTSEVITGYYTSAPACGAGNAATFDLQEGTYAYTAQCAGKTWSGQVTVKPGACTKVQLTGGSTGSGSATGQAMFWIATDLACGNITVNLSGMSRTISSYYNNGAPTCGASGSATFDLAPGTYSYSAQCSGKTWSGTVTVPSGGCSKIQLTGGNNSGSGSTTGQGMVWIASDFGCGNITVTCNGVSRIITSYYRSGAPACGSNGTATFNFSPGSYSFSARCSNKTWNGTLNITANGCSKVQLTL